MPEMPADPRRQAQQHPDQSCRLVGPGFPFLAPGQCHNSGHRCGHQQRGFEQQHGAGHQAGDGPPECTGSAAVELQQGQPKQSHGRQLGSIQHGQTSVPGHRQQRQQNHAGGEGAGAISRPQRPLQPASKGHHQARQQGGCQTDRPLRRELVVLCRGADHEGDQAVQTRCLVEVGLVPEGGQQRGFPEAVAKFEGHPGHGGFIEVPQGEIAEADQGQHGSGYAERHQCDPGCCVRS